MDAPNTGLFARFRAFIEAVDYSGVDYTLDRIRNSEQEIARLKVLLERAGINVESANEIPNP